MRTGAQGIQKKRFAVSKNSTDPDVAKTAAILSTLRAAVDSTIGNRPAAGAAGMGRVDFDRFLAAIMNPLRGQAAFAA